MSGRGTRKELDRKKSARGRERIKASPVTVVRRRLVLNGVWVGTGFKGTAEELENIRT